MVNKACEPILMIISPLKPSVPPDIFEGLHFSGALELTRIDRAGPHSFLEDTRQRLCLQDFHIRKPPSELGVLEIPEKPLRTIKQFFLD